MPLKPAEKVEKDTLIPLLWQRLQRFWLQAKRKEVDVSLKRVIGTVSAMGFFLIAGVAAAESSYVTGAEWQASSENEKLAYVMGVANTINAEHSVQVESTQPPSKEQSAVPEMYAGLEGANLTGMVEAVDAYFSANPDRVGDTVLDVLWIIFVEK